MQVNEIFLSIQGEAKEIGLPTVFVRFVGCNLRCVYCDTSYAYEGGINMTPKEIYNKVVSTSKGYKRVCLTGGEPLIQPKKDLKELISSLIEGGYYISIETNGSIDLKYFTELETPYGVKAVDSFVVDYKSKSSGMEEKMLLNNITMLSQKDQVKFVIGDKVDFDSAITLIKKWKKELIVSGLPSFIFSPVWEKVKPEDLVKWILDTGIDIRMQVQLHKIIWGAVRKGV